LTVVGLIVGIGGVVVIAVVLVILVILYKRQRFVKLKKMPYSLELLLKPDTIDDAVTSEVHSVSSMQLLDRFEQKLKQSHLWIH
jgi:hypothetical protein